MSSLLLIHNEIRRFLKSPEPEVLCISGKWGVGKTYAWKHYVLDAQSTNEIQFKRYAYVSLFGLNSLDELKQRIFEESVEVGKIGGDANFETVKSSVRFATKLFKRHMIDVGKTIPGVGKYIPLFSQEFLFWTVRRQIVCIDDLERAGEGLAAKDLLGLVSFLKEERHCKVSLLLNEDELDEKQKKDFTKLLEKVVDAKLLFEPDPREAADLGLSDDPPFKENLTKNIIKLGITNLRVIKKIERTCSRLAELLTEFDPGVLAEAVHSATLFGWVIYQPNDAPPLNFVTRYTPWLGILDEKNELPEQEKNWRIILSDFGFTNFDELDGEILRGMQAGYFNTAALKKFAAASNARIRHTKIDNSIRDAWQYYHSSFKIGADEVVAKLTSGIRSSAKVMSPINFSAALELLKYLERGEEGKELLELYMRERDGEPREFFDLARGPFGSEARDPDLRAAFKQKLESFRDDRNPAEILANIGSKGGWNQEDLTLLAKLSPAEFEKMFLELEGSDLSVVIRAALEFGTFVGASEEMKRIAASATEALQNIAAQSPINARRVASYGVKPKSG